MIIPTGMNNAPKIDYSEILLSGAENNKILPNLVGTFRKSSVNYGAFEILLLDNAKFKKKRLHHQRN